MTSLDAFLRAQREQEYPPDPEMLTALEALFTDPSLPASTAARTAMTQVIAAEDANPKPNPNLESFWILLFQAIGLFTEQNDRLLELILAIQSLPDCKGGFHKLPGIHEYLLEFVFDYVDHPFNLPYSDPEPDITDRAWLHFPPHRDIQRQAWLNVNLFMAKLHPHVTTTPVYGFIGHGEFTIRKTLEKAPWEIVHHENLEEHLSFWLEQDEEEYDREKDDQMEMIDIRTLDGWVPAAAVWFRLCGRAMYEKEGHEMSSEWEGSKWTGKPGWSRERWAFWKERWGWIAQVTALNRGTREIAREMVEVMGRVGTE
ncbi:hypothetical protein BO78DRAFT_401863 [Aspergillus sclerotiicarbonarius CBS 121057]|uniref:Uncharacterized protein n=1 Tax=Aspergillus sclerotiicarbonarius (strain CBS 121057 / IBT 28362) TaxID=1448318 RepID=A0A319E2L8_ASPSB|nr:hypothetical protein BO78DRAFT_401863 [Aspergillus sclerotiicarbonarius CBS 121057]